MPHNICVCLYAHTLPYTHRKKKQVKTFQHHGERLFDYFSTVEGDKVEEAVHQLPPTKSF